MYINQQQTEQIQPLHDSGTFVKEMYSTKQVENIVTNLDLQNGYFMKNTKNISNDENKLNNNGDKKIEVKCHRCFTRSPSNIGLSLSRPSRPSLPPNMKFSPPNQNFAVNCRNNNNNTVQERKNQIFSPEMLSGQILFVYNS